MLSNDLKALTANKRDTVTSHITIIVKYYIHICRIKKQIPCTGVLRRRILYSQFLESQITKKKKIKWSSTMKNGTRFKKILG